MDHLAGVKNRLPSSNVSSWLISGVCIALALHILARRRKLLVRLPGPPPKSFNTGHFKELLGAGWLGFQEHIFSTYGPTVKLNGAWGEEFLFTRDPTATHSILIKEKGKFERPEGTSLMMNSIFGGGLLGLRGEEHRTHRKLLNPVFTMKYLRELAALELIGEAGLGYSFNSFTGERNEYIEAAKSVAQLFARLVPLASILPYVNRIGTPSFRRWIIERIPSPFLQRVLLAVTIQNQMAGEVLRARQALLSSGVDLSSQAGRGRDIITLFMKANEAKGSEFRLSHQEMIGHMNAFIFAGHETTSTAVTRMLEVLANHPQIQVRLQEEIRQYFEEHTNDTHHDGLLELPFLDGVVRETLRLHGPIVSLARACEEDTILPLEYPVDTPTGKITSIPVKKGTRIFMSVAIMNRDDRIWGERSREFWPERWIGHKIEGVTQPGAHLPGVYSSM
ncbi:Cytochrome P450 family protein [Ceratobasidium theobromae]|uniref:Cytochrome P450 family protein n=1 Tax=Ceratobasidium theobromae TaxID=1582974 RepID=A0A5N5QNJ7_9AGAM|nr:Cytochrome P450 family protein [Ceratobasidium theobromae]